jgi:hypothetical protein
MRHVFADMVPNLNLVRRFFLPVLGQISTDTAVLCWYSSTSYPSTSTSVPVQLCPTPARTKIQINISTFSLTNSRVDAHCARTSKYLSIWKY